MTATERSGEAVADRSIDKIRMALERSNTDIAGDMVRIIETQRSYQMSARVVQTADELERITSQQGDKAHDASILNFNRGSVGRYTAGCCGLYTAIRLIISEVYYDKQLR